MIVIMKYFTILFLNTILVTSSGYGQPDSGFIAATDQYILLMDSLANADQDSGLKRQDRFKNVYTFIEEGKIYISARNLEGPFSSLTTSGENGRNVYKIETEDNLAVWRNRKYYYKGNRLVFARIELKDNGKTPVLIYARKEYYRNDSIIHRETMVNKVSHDDSWRTDVNLQLTSRTFLTRHLNQQAAMARQSLPGAGEPMRAGNGRSITASPTVKYKYRMFIVGKVHYRDGDSAVYPFNLNYLTETMDVIGDDGKIAVLANPETIRYIAIRSDTFYYEKGYLELIKQTRIARLAIRKTFKWNAAPLPISRSWSSAAYGGTGALGMPTGRNSGFSPQYFGLNSRSNYLKPDTAFYISDTRSPFVRATKKNVARVFSEKNRMIGKYLSSRNVNMRKRKDLEELVEYISE